VTKAAQWNVAETLDKFPDVTAFRTKISTNNWANKKKPIKGHI
jgi:hypothetical protein